MVVSRAGMAGTGRRVDGAGAARHSASGPRPIGWC